MTKKHIIIFHILILVTLMFPWALGVHAQGKATSGVTKIYALKPDMISEYIDKTKGQKRVLYIYTSWCGYCRIMMPKIMDLERSKKGSVIAVSVDEHYKKYESYAKKLGDAPFPLIFNKGNEGNLQKRLAAYKIRPWNGYPTLILLDENSMAVGRGNNTAEQAAEYVLGE